MKPRVYIAGPISKGDLGHNVDQATEAFVELLRAGFAPFCPHWSVYCKPVERVLEAVLCVATVNGMPGISHEDWLGVDIPWVDVSDAVLRLPGESKGADMEVAHAEKKGIPVFRSVADLVSFNWDCRRVEKRL